eukprot:Rmarinus@m.21535
MGDELDDVYDASWRKLLQHVTWSLATQGVLGVALPIIGELWDKRRAEDEESNEEILRREGTAKKSFHSRLDALLGLSKYNAVAAALDTLQITVSLCVLALWVYRTYNWDDMHSIRELETVALVILVILYSIEAVRHDFHGGWVWSSVAMIDVITIISIFLCLTHHTDTWLHFGFLRSLSALWAFERVSTNFRGPLSDVQVAMTRSVLRFAALVICFAAVMFITEVLGDIDGLTDRTFLVPMGDVSFYQMCYFIFVTISTVGYGDYSPVTFLGRAIIIIFIIAGVVFFSLETSTIVDLHNRQLTGGGRYVPTIPIGGRIVGTLSGRKRIRKHVILTGGGLRNASIVRAFLEELFFEEHADTKNLRCVLLSEFDPTHELTSLCKEEWVRNRVTFILGSPLNHYDLQRACLQSAEMCFVLPDITKTGESATFEDKENIVRAVAMLRWRSNLNLRLMVITVLSRVLAISSGIRKSQCYSLMLLKANLLSSSCRCPGFSALIVNLGVSARAPSTCVERPEWETEYLYGAAQEIYIIVPTEAFLGESRQGQGRPFLELARDAYVNHGITIFGSLRDQNISLFPANQRIKRGDRLIVIASSESHTNTIAEHEESLSYHKLLNMGANWTRNRMDSIIHLMDTRKSEPPLLENEAGCASPLHTSMSRPISQIISKPGATGHILLLCPPGNLWAQVESFIEPLRTPALPTHPKITVLSPEDCPERLRDRFTMVTYVKGSSLDLQDLVKADIAHAIRIVTLCGHVSSHGSLVDSEAILTASALRSFRQAKDLADIDRRGMVDENDQFAIIDLHQDHVVPVLPSMSGEAVPDSEVHPLIAGGRVFTSSSLTKVFAQCYYNRELLQVIEALTCPQPPQTAVSSESPEEAHSATILPWFVPLPTEHVDQEFSETFEEILTGGALCLGVYRAPGVGGSSLSYMCASPSPRMRVNSGDMAIVLASRKWAEEHGVHTLTVPRRSTRSFTLEFASQLGER